MMKALHFGFGLGAFISPLLVGWMIDVMDGDPKWAFWIISISGIPISIWLFRFDAVLGDKNAKITPLNKKQIVIKLHSQIIDDNREFL
jgi:FHS family Na+ dependent glucose MFS transporter 1